MSPKASNDTSIDALKDLLIKSEKEQIQKIQTRLDDPMIRATELSSFLPEAISLSILNNNKIPQVIAPIINETIKASVRDNPKIMADAIFPALGPGIRKAISSIIMGMVQSLNQVLNHSFSIQGMKWRFEAFRTGKQFGEVVLLHTLVYKVEQIFLIHRESGIVLDHVVAKDTIIQDPDLVSGMLTAIQDFVNDSFQMTTQDELETLRIGSDTSVWIEKGEHACIAAVIRGTPPLDLRTQYKKLIEEIHIKSGASLENFDGDPFHFAIFREQLNQGLQSKEKKQEKKTSPLIWCIGIVLLSAIGFWAVHYYQTQKVWHSYIDRLEAHPGLIILSAQKKDGHHKIVGLKDPLEIDPATLIKSTDKDRIKLISHWRPFYSLEPDFVLQRASNILNPPPTTKLTLVDTLIIAQGEASDNWINSFLKSAKTIAGIEDIDIKKLRNIDKQNLKTSLKQLSNLKLYFKNNSTQLIENQKNSLTQISELFNDIQKLKTLLNDPVKIIITGHTDSSGTEKQNLKLSHKRAQLILNNLIQEGIDPSFLSFYGIGTKTPLKKEIKVNDRKYNRAVSFKSSYTISTKGRKI